MKHILTLLSVIILTTFISCTSGNSNHFLEVNRFSVNGVFYEDYDEYVDAHFNTLKSPVVLIGKRSSIGSYSIVVKDSTGVVKTYGNISVLANSIGASRQIGDTLK